MASTAPRDGNGNPDREVDVAFESADGKALKGRLWTVVDPRATLVISHGLGEHSGSYRRTAVELSRQLRLDVLAFDFRGSGRSDGKRGVVRKYGDLSLDLVAAFDWVARNRPGLPRFLLGHSNGGLVALRTVLETNLGLTGLIVSNPSLRLSAHVPVWKRLVGEVLLRVAPNFTLQTGLSNEQLTGDPELIAEIASDLLRHNRISSPLFFGMKSEGPKVIARAGVIRVPTLMIVGGSDPVIDPKSGRECYDRLGTSDKTLKIYPEMRHEPLNDLRRAEVIADIVEWIEHRLNPIAPRTV